MTSQDDSDKPVSGKIAYSTLPGLRPPGDFDELRYVIASQHAQLPKRLARVARQIMDNPVEVALGNVASIAAAAQVAPSTLIRFAQLLGYDGFSALQEVVQKAARGKCGSRLSARVVGGEAEMGAHGKHLLQHAVAVGHLALDTMTEGISVADIQTASRILSEANCIFILAGPGMLPVASFFRNYLSSLQIRSVLVENGRNSDVLDFATIGDAAVAVDSSSFTETTSGARRLTDRGLPLIVLTDSEFSPLAEMAAVNFKVIETGEAGMLRITAGIALCEALVLSTHHDRQDAIPESPR
ncbi:SIS domain-containing protein [Agrobacterium vitis]|uniref:SIS domain-containing protein n=1 Tax=Agrobacterium vitis TaxID=373 RepID=A0A6L6VML9_AGRVI|nr:MurR/RpiR family transcriptional regulator [Agrobacterium vitis]MUZ75417.1 SIS domain-containing protein [Agrobacterium vitis]